MFAGSGLASCRVHQLPAMSTFILSTTSSSRPSECKCHVLFALLACLFVFFTLCICSMILCATVAKRAVWKRIILHAVMPNIL